MARNRKSQLIGNMEVVRTQDSLILRFSRPFLRKAAFILLAMLLVGIALVISGSRLLGGELDRFTVDLLLLFLGSGLVALSLWGLSHVTRHGLRWTVLDRRSGLFQHPGPLLGFTRALALGDILRVELFRKESSDEQPATYRSVVNRVGLILENRQKPYFPWGTWGGPDRPIEIARLLSSFVAKTKDSANNEIASEESSFDSLLQSRIGPYVREELRELDDSIGGTTYATYRMAGVAVFVEIGICDNAAESRLALETARSELSSEFPDWPIWEETRGDSLFLVTVNPRGAFTAWTQGRYYYSAHTASGKTDLDAFLQVFRSTRTSATV